MNQDIFLNFMIQKFDFKEFYVEFFFFFIPTIKRGSPIHMQTMPMITMPWMYAGLVIVLNICISVSRTGFPCVFMFSNDWKR